MSNDYDIPGVTAEDVDHFIEMQRRCAQWAAPPPGKISVTPAAAPRTARDELNTFRFPGHDETDEVLKARAAAYNRAVRSGLVKMFRRK